MLTGSFSYTHLVSIAAGEIVGLLYDAFYKQYADPSSERALKSLNILCVRLVFCLYAEDAGIFGRHGMFHDYLAELEARKMRRALIELFKVLDTPPEQRDPYLKEDFPELAAFPYVNGGLFQDEEIEIPPVTDEIRDLLLSKASAEFDWSEISPTIFGAVFESTLNPETRRSGGMHYTSIENIHKVIDPLFLEELKGELRHICEIAVEKERNLSLIHIWCRSWNRCGRSCKDAGPASPSAPTASARGCPCWPWQGSRWTPASSCRRCA